MYRKHNGLELMNNLEENLKTLNELEEKQEDIGPLQLFKNTILLRFTWNCLCLNTDKTTVHVQTCLLGCCHLVGE